MQEEEDVSDEDEESVAISDKQSLIGAAEAKQIKKSLGLQSLSSTTASCPEAPPLPAKQPAAADAPQQPQAPAGATTCGQCKQALPPAAVAQLQQQVTDPDSERSHCAYAGSCSEDCYSYSGSVCSCAGSCDQQPAAGPEFGCEEFNHRSCCAELQSMEHGTLHHRHMVHCNNVNSFDQGHIGSENHLLENHASSETIPLEMCQDIPDVLVWAHLQWTLFDVTARCILLEESTPQGYLQQCNSL